MRKLLVIGLMTVVALALVGVAVAHLTASGTAAVSATFSATTSQGVKSRTCNGPDGVYELIDAVYAGHSTSSEAALDGDARVRIHSVYNTTEKIGWATGSLKLDNANTRFDAVNVNGKLTGLVRGRVNDLHTALLGSFAADFSAGGLANGALGGGGSIPNVALLAGKICTDQNKKDDDDEKRNDKKGDKSVKLEVEGAIDSIIPSVSISVLPVHGSVVQTCALGPGSPSVTGFAKGQDVEMTCATVDGKLTLVRIKRG